jgi:kinesin family protein 4/21/27
MEQLHERQQHVMRRKIEETVAVNKRLKDALEKQAMARAQKGGDKVLTGSGT